MGTTIIKIRDTSLKFCKCNVGILGT
uniref:Uncharacterized protein n=1 Tax=Arundo donax TaxID=35708 RepID=A0A0A8YXC6_ARUDO